MGAHDHELPIQRRMAREGGLTCLYYAGLASITDAW